MSSVGEEDEADMPKYIHARAAADAGEERGVRKLAGSRHGPADVIRRAHMVVASWEGKTTQVIARELDCHPQTVRERVSRFNELGLDGLQDAPGRGRKARLTEQERSTIVSLIGQAPPGQLVREGDGELHVEEEHGEAHWTLNALARVAQERGIRVKRSQIRRIFLKEGIPWRRTHSWADSTDPDFVPKGRRSSRSIPNPR
jgi:transposase